MKGIKSISSSKITLSALFASGFFLPIHTGLDNISLILIISLSVFSFIREGASWNWLRQPWFYLQSTVILFLPLLLGTFFAPSFHESFGTLGRYVFYLLVPLVILRIDLDKEASLRMVASGLISGSLIGAIYLLTLNFKNFFAADLPLNRLLGYYYTNKAFVAPLPGFHPTYLGTYYLMATSLVLSRRVFPKLSIVIKIFISVILLIAMFFISSRAVYITGLILLIVLLFQNGNMKKLLYWTAAIFLFTLVMNPVLRDTYLYKNLIFGTIWDLSGGISTKGIDPHPGDTRMSRWKVAFQLIMENPIKGYGTGEAKDVLVEAYKEKNMEISFERKYDSHNEFLNYALQSGVIGFICILIFFAFNLKAAISNSDPNCLGFFIILFFVCLSENYLSRNMGINFVALFSMLWLLPAPLNRTMVKGK